MIPNYCVRCSTFRFTRGGGGVSCGGVLCELVPKVSKNFFVFTRGKTN